MIKTTLYTSIPADLDRLAGSDNYGATYIQECIRSWMEAGFRVVSVNPKCELDILSNRGLKAELVSNGTKDKRPSIGDIFKHILARGEAVAGIINADCYLLNPGFALEAIVGSAGDSLVLLERIGIDSRTMSPINHFCGGFDGFIFDTHFLETIPHGDQWHIGSPQWDYWFPIQMHIAGARLKRPDTLFLLHLEHVTRWSKSEYLENALQLWELLAAQNAEVFPDKLSGMIKEYQTDKMASEESIEAFINCAADWIFSHREISSPCKPGDPGDFLRRILKAHESRMRFE